jgi:hypothetical protein
MKDHDRRLGRLELAQAPKHFPYVIRVSDPPTAAELAQMRANGEAGRPFAIMPHPCNDGAEWMARHTPLEQR